MFFVFLFGHLRWTAGEKAGRGWKRGDSLEQIPG